MDFSVFVILFLSLIAGTLSKNVRIIGGADSHIRFHPYAVTIRYSPTNELQCTGAIVSHKHILTSAHCINKYPAKIYLLRIYVGTSSISRTDGPYYEIGHIDNHPAFLDSMEGHSIYPYDLSIITVIGEIVFNEYQNKIDLPTSNVRLGDVAVMAGWGKHTKSNGALIEIIQEVYTLTVDKTTCARSHPFEINEDKLCVFKSYGVGICYGDSGLPLVANGKLIGIASFGVPCAVGLSDIFTNVYACIDFIRSIVPYERS